MMVQNIHVKDSWSHENDCERIPNDREKSILQLLWTPPSQKCYPSSHLYFPLTSEGTLFGFHPHHSSRDKQ